MERSGMREWMECGETAPGFRFAQPGLQRMLNCYRDMTNQNHAFFT